MCCGPFGAGARTVRQGAAAGDVWVNVAVPAGLLALAVELELDPHPAIARTATMIGNALRTGRQAKQISCERAAGA